MISRPNISARPSSLKLAFRPSAGTHSARVSSTWPSNTAPACISSRASAAAVTAAANQAQAARRAGVLPWPIQAQPTAPIDSGNNTTSARDSIARGF